MRTRTNENGQNVWYCRECDANILRIEDVYQNEFGEDVCADCSLKEQKEFDL